MTAARHKRCRASAHSGKWVYPGLVTNTEGDPVVVITSSAAKVKHLQAGAKWRYKGRPYRTTGIVALEHNKGEPQRWEVRGVPSEK